MSEEILKKSLYDQFLQSQMTFEEAEEKSKKEAGRPKVERFRIGEDGEYPLRILPLAPTFDDEGHILPMDRKGYEYPLRQFFLTINLPEKKGKKSKPMRIPVVHTNDKDFGPGYSVDLIDTYVRIAKEMYGDDEELMKAMTDSAFKNPSSLKWQYQHAIFVLDISSDKERAKGPQLWQCTQTNYKAIDDAKIRLWRELKEDDPKATDPIAGINNSYGVKIVRGNTNGKVDYTVEIGRKFVDLTEAEIKKLIDMPRLPEIIYRFTRYHLEAEVEFLKQYDELHDIDVTEQSDFKDAVETLKGELPADDTSHFDLSTASSDKGSKSSAEVTVDSLWADFDALSDQGVDEKSDEYQDLRERIRQFAEDHDLDVRLSHSKSNKQLLEEIEEAYEEKAHQSKKSDVEKDADKEEDKPEKDTDETSKRKHTRDDDDEEPEEPVRRRRPRPSVDDDEEEKEAEEETPKRKHTRDDEDDDKDDDKDNDKDDDDKSQSEEESESEEESRPIHRRRRR
jgi:hypothetical protein